MRVQAVNRSCLKRKAAQITGAMGAALAIFATSAAAHQPIYREAALSEAFSKRLARGWMAGARWDSGRLSKPVWTASCGPRPPVGGIAASDVSDEEWALLEPHLPAP